MIALALSILSSTMIFVVFKLFSKFKINTLHAIVFNYITACFLGIILQKNTVDFTTIPNYGWFPYTLALGVLFIIVFNLMALTTQRSGLSVVSVATKMSVVIPVLFGLIYYEESLSAFKIIGIILALIAVYLASIKTKDGIKIKSSNLIFPILVFFGGGIIDTTIKYLEGEFVAKDDIPIFTATIYAVAGTIGFSILIFHAIKGKFQFKLKNVIGGIVLGIPNFFSIYFLVQALRSGIFDSSGVFTINNVAIVMASTILGILLFKEKLLIKNWIGIGLAVLGILFIALAV
ncbi:EamA-like transporter family [Aequorivita sublithincola DSM 14238]|uniref:EamA-like transporter family n=1 Tax=Aequorivita sublithincola (strain DSM 14238 / LMG 21431 / ACAM 643 / 9-3) TaxID=746697 RepID=I3Z0A2_AEQSU|nr:EamA family transporter [Aequorivita sublithincola]AFL82670.1 EamA-like transporter family [Aequorivita sublithincola DSM 14238]